LLKKKKGRKKEKGNLKEVEAKSLKKLRKGNERKKAQHAPSKRKKWTKRGVENIKIGDLVTGKERGCGEAESGGARTTKRIGSEGKNGMKMGQNDG